MAESLFPELYKQEAKPADVGLFPELSVLTPKEKRGDLFPELYKATPESAIAARPRLAEPTPSPGKAFFKSLIGQPEFPNIPEATPEQKASIKGGFKPMVKEAALKAVDKVADVGEELIRLPLYPVMAAAGSQKAAKEGKGIGGMVSGMKEGVKQAGEVTPSQAGRVYASLATLGASETVPKMWKEAEGEGLAKVGNYIKNSATRFDRMTPEEQNQFIFDSVLYSNVAMIGKGVLSPLSKKAGNIVSEKIAQNAPEFSAPATKAKIADNFAHIIEEGGWNKNTLPQKFAILKAAAEWQPKKVPPEYAQITQNALANIAKTPKPVGTPPLLPPPITPQVAPQTVKSEPVVGEPQPFKEIVKEIETSPINELVKEHRMSFNTEPGGWSHIYDIEKGDPSTVIGTSGLTTEQVKVHILHEAGHLNTLEEGELTPHFWAKYNDKVATEMEAWLWALQNADKYGVKLTREIIEKEAPSLLGVNPNIIKDITQPTSSAVKQPDLAGKVEIHRNNQYVYAGEDIPRGVSKGEVVTATGQTTTQGRVEVTKSDGLSALVKPEDLQEYKPLKQGKIEVAAGGKVEPLVSVKPQTTQEKIAIEQAKIAEKNKAVSQGTLDVAPEKNMFATTALEKEQWKALDEIEKAERIRLKDVKFRYKDLQEIFGKETPQEVRARGLGRRITTSPNASGLDELVEMHKTTEMDLINSISSQSWRNQHKGGFVEPSVLRSIVQPSAYFHALDDIYYKVLGKRMEKGFFSLLDRVTPEVIKKNLVEQYGQPEEYKKLTDMLMAEKAINSDKLADLAARFNKIPKKDYAGIRQMMESGQFPDTPLGKLAMESAETFLDLGQQLVHYNILKPGQFEKYAGVYFPHFYRIFDKQGQLNSLFRKRLNLSYTKARKDIPEELQKAMGIIDNTPEPIFRRMMQEMGDVATQRFFEAVFQTPGLAYTTSHPDFVQLPKNKKLGYLSEMYVHPAIAEDIQAMVYVPQTIDRFSSLALSLWKAGKVVLNPPTVARNIVTNIFFLADILGGVPPEDVYTWATALKDLTSKGEGYKGLLVRGKLGVEYYPEEVKALLESVQASGGDAIKGISRVAGKIMDKPGRFYQAMEQWSKIAVYNKNIEYGKTPDEAAEIAEKALFNYFKLPPLIKQLRSASAQGPLGSLGVIGANPFMTFRYKATQGFSHALFRRPFSILKWAMILGGITYASAKALGLSKEKMKAIQKAVINRGKAGLPLPFKSGSKEEQYALLDLTFVLPVIGDALQLSAETKKGDFIKSLSNAEGFFSGPVMSLVVGLLSNKEPYSGYDIYSPLDDAGDKWLKQFNFVYKTLSPPIAPFGYTTEKVYDTLTKKPTRTGEEQTMRDMWMYLGGMKTIQFSPKAYKEGQGRYFSYLTQEFYKKRASIARDKSLPVEERKRQIAAELEKLKRKRQEIKTIIGGIQ